MMIARSASTARTGAGMDGSRSPATLTTRNPQCSDKTRAPMAGRRRPLYLLGLTASSHLSTPIDLIISRYLSPHVRVLRSSLSRRREFSSAMSHGGVAGAGGQPSCTTVSMGKAFRRALRKATGVKKKERRPAALVRGREVSVEVASSMSSSSSSAAAAARREAVVRVVLKSGVVEVYPGVVLACTVIRKHPPGLCLAHPDVFRNPHGAVVRPLEPLFPGQKFLLLPESTVVKLKQRIPESSIGAFADDDDDDDDDDVDNDTGSDEVTSTEASSEEHSGGEAAAAEEEEEEREMMAAAAAGGDGGFMPGCCARSYYEARERWSECHFKKLVARGLAVEPSKDDRPEKKDQKAAKKTKKGRSRKSKGGGKKRRERPAATAATPPAGHRIFATAPRRTWEPSLPSVEEEDDDHER
ncbi:hypothetical protein ACP4OV_001684 [Aristida adscensionis]